MYVACQTGLQSAARACVERQDNAVGAIAGLLAVLSLIKVVTAIHPLGSNQHYYPHSPNSPNGAVTGRKYGAA